MFSGSVNIERSPGGSEDAPPLLKDLSADLSFLFVFDGLGGSGARTVNGPDGAHSSAYYAARYAREECERLIDTKGNSAEFGSEELGLAIDTRLRSASQESSGPGQSVLKGSLIRQFPTTIAGAKISGKGDVTVFWAGDSRVYILNPLGLFQVTSDHIKGEIDPFRNLRQDAPLTNVACADTPVRIEVRSVTVDPPFIVLCATDGCFGFLQTPMHFEDLLLDAFCGASSPDEASEIIRQKIDPVTGDDATLCWASSGWTSYAELAEALRARSAQLKASFIKPIDDKYSGLKEIDELHLKAKKQLEELLEASWNNYRGQYLLETNGAKT